MGERERGVYASLSCVRNGSSKSTQEDFDYEEYYEFLKTTIIEFLENNQELKEQYNFKEEFHG